MPRRFSSSRRSASMPVSAFTNAVFPWSICPAVPTIMFFIGVAPILLSAQAPTFRAGVTLVKVDVAVTRSNGRTVPDLTEKDFVVYDEKVPQKIVHFEHESEPLDLLLLLDVSGSMHRFLTDMSTAAQAALRPLGRSDRVALMLFAREAAVRQVFTPDIDVVAPGIAAAVKTEDLGSGTAINSAIVAAAGYMGRQPPTARRAILIVTDNLSLNYRISDEEVLRALYAADSTLDVILIGK